MKAIGSILYWTWCLLFFPVLCLVMLAMTIGVTALLLWMLFSLGGLFQV